MHERSSLMKMALVKNAHAQMTMSNGVIIPPHNFKQPYLWNYRVKDGRIMSLQWSPVA
jgi:hypothetical protein